MKLNQINEIIQEIGEYSPRKARRLQKLAEAYERETENVKKTMIYNRIFNYVYRIFTSCLTKETREDLAYTNAIINEDCYQVESRAKNRFYIASEGVRRSFVKNGEPTVRSFIKREYQKGFYLDPEAADNSPEEQSELLLQSTFYESYKIKLNEISSLMDHKSELLTYFYEIKDPRISRSFTEHLIDFLGLDRLEEEKGKDGEKAPQKVKKDN